MRIFKGMAALLASFVLAACGGGGGSAGSAPFGPGAGASSPTGGGGTPQSAQIAVEVQRAGAATGQITSTETVQAVAVVTSAGAPVQGVVVTFAEQGPRLLEFAPAAATALTDTNGRAVLDMNAADAAQTGATAVTAAAQVGGTDLTGSRSIQITAGATNPGTPPTPAAITFVGSVPSGTAIVIKGAGGAGRSESAILSFRVVDATNAPINGATVNFTINPNNGGATFLPASAVSNSSGLVTTTVSSGPNPASIVILGTAVTLPPAPTVSTQSSTLLVSTGAPVVGGFEIVAAKYNLDGRLTGDSTTITAFVRDANGNPVADGVAVSFTTDNGVVASSAQGGCTTTNGQCTVTFRVQNPRGNGLATVIGTVGTGATTLSDEKVINMAGATGTPYLALDPATGLTVTRVTLDSCKQAVEMRLSDGSNRSTAAGTVIAAPFASSNLTATLKTGTPVLDQLAPNFPPTLFGVEVDVSATALRPLCVPGGTVQLAVPAVFFNLEFKTPNNIVFPQRIEVAYPQ